MRRDYRLYELNEDEFESLVVKICARWFGPGVTPFAKGRDAAGTAGSMARPLTFPARGGLFRGIACSKRNMLTLLDGWLDLKLLRPYDYRRTANASGAHLSEGDLFLAGEGGHGPIKAQAGSARKSSYGSGLESSKTTAARGC
jgi:hypothetical protein